MMGPFVNNIPDDDDALDAFIASQGIDADDFNKSFAPVDVEDATDEDFDFDFDDDDDDF